ncbi:MAG: PadR family transcriptional regulator [Ilumatobacteraceae bacterium]
MSRGSRTELAVLGALSVEPMSGYAVRQAITDTLGHFWSESFGQIYPALARLEEEGLIRRAGDGQTSGSTFCLTTAGRRHLVNLLREPMPTPPPRNGTLLRLFFGRLLGVDECRSIVLDALARAEASLAELSAVHADVEGDTDPNAPFWLLTVSAGEHSARAQIAWAKEALEILDAIAD